jgi:hypothetical protein
MAATPATRHGGAPKGYEGGQRAGLRIFAAAVLAVLGFFNLLDGIAAIANSHVFVANAHYVVGGLRAWGWAVLILGVLELAAAGGIVAGSLVARWFGATVVGLNAVSQMFFLPSYPFWSILIIVVDIAALYAICAYDAQA